jgi:hypothetical protein
MNQSLKAPMQNSVPQHDFGCTMGAFICLAGNETPEMYLFLGV